MNKTLISLFAAYCTLHAGVRAEGDAGDPLAERSDDEIRAELMAGLSSNVAISIEFVEIGATAVAELLRQHEQQADGEWLRGELLTMEKKGEAQVVESSYVVTRSGQRAKLETVREWIYPTEWERPGLPEEVGGPIDSAAVIKAPNSPTAFDVRPVGHTIEVDPVVDANGNDIAVNFAPELVEFRGNRQGGQGESANRLPEFHSQKLVSALKCRNGRAELFGVTSASPDRPGRRVLGFITVDLLKCITTKNLGRLERAPRKYAEELIAQIPPDPSIFENPFEAAGSHVEVEVGKTSPQLSFLAELIEVDVDEARRIVGSLGSSSDASGVKRRLDRMVASGDANLVDSAYGMGRSGQRLKVESAREWIYPTEVSPPELPKKLSGPIGAGVGLVTPASSTAFEMRKLGMSLEVDAVLGADGETIEFNIAPERVVLAGELEYGQGASLSKTPLFETFSVSTSAAMPSGTSLLLAMGSHETARAGQGASEQEQDEVAGRRLLLFITANARPAR